MSTQPGEGSTAGVTPVVPQAGPTCRKCGGVDIAIAWHRSQWDCPFGQRDAWQRLEAGGEHLHHTCRTCGYHWPEVTRDA